MTSYLRWSDILDNLSAVWIHRLLRKLQPLRTWLSLEPFDHGSLQISWAPRKLIEVWDDCRSCRT